MSEADPPSLRRHEREALERLTKLDTPPAEEIIDYLENDLRAMRVIPEKILSGNDLYRGHIVLLGLTGRAHDYVLGTIDAIGLNNRHAAKACLRGLLETFAAIAWVNDNPGRLLSLLEQGDSAPGLKKMRDSASTRLDGLEQNYSRWSGTVHPRVSSLVESFTRAEGESDPRVHQFTFPAPPLGEGEIKEMTENAARLGDYIYRELRILMENHPEAVQTGEPIASIEADNLTSD